MTKLEISKLEVDKVNLFDGHLNLHAKTMVNVLGEDLPFSMALAIANYTMSSYIGHFHFMIEIEKENLVPPNMLAFVLAKSGARKTSSMLTLEKTLKKGYTIINSFRIAKEQRLAELHDTNPRPIAPLANALATEEGMIQRLNDFKKEGIGLPALFVDEISTELATSADIIPNIKLVSQLFDAGDMKSKPLKDREKQSEEVVGMGMTALFMGSEHGLLEDDAILKKFDDEFISKLARRCYFIFPEFIELDDDFLDAEALLELMDEQETASRNLSDMLNNRR